MSDSDKPSARRPARRKATAEDVLVHFKGLSAMLDARQIAAAICDAASDLLDVQACSVFLPNACHDALTLAASRHIPMEEWPQITVKAWDGLLGRVWANGKSIALGTKSAFRELNVEVRERYGPPACLIVPMLDPQGAVIGVICAASPRGRSKFIDRELTLLEMIAIFAAGSLGAAARFQETATMHDRLSEILDNLHVGVAALDQQLRIIHANHRFAAFSARPLDGILGHRLKDVLDLQLYNFCHRLIREAPDEISIVQERFEGSCGGRPLRCVVTISNLKTACGAGDFLMMVEDISHEEEIRRLRESDAIKRSFLRIISHELRTPITVLQGLVPVMEDPNASAQPERLANARGMLRSNIQRLNHTVNMLLDAVDIENGKLVLTLRDVDLNNLVQGQVNALLPRIEAKKLALRINLQPDLPPVSADAQRMRNMLAELLDNAVKFCSEEGTIRVSTSAGAGMASVMIADTGEVIPAEKRDEVFDKFYQVDRETTRKTNGMGLGLYVSRNLALLHGGSLELVDGESDHETAFRLNLPLAPAEPDKA